MYQTCHDKTCRKYGQYVSADHAYSWHNVRAPSEDDFDEHGELRRVRW